MSCSNMKEYKNYACVLSFMSFSLISKDFYENLPDCSCCHKECQITESPYPFQLEKTDDIEAAKIGNYGIIMSI